MCYNDKKHVININDIKTSFSSSIVIKPKESVFLLYINNLFVSDYVYENIERLADEINELINTVILDEFESYKAVYEKITIQEYFYEEYINNSYYVYVPKRVKKFI